MWFIVRAFLEHRLLAWLLLTIVIAAGLYVSPLEWRPKWFPSDPVPVDAIPDLGENQQIILTEWPGRSPQDVEDQITYPLVSWLLGTPGVKTIRSTSMFGYSFIYVIFEEDVDFYWARARLVEKLSSIPAGLLPEGVSPQLGPDATALGQVFWYTLEGRDPETGEPVGGWDPWELRTIQDFYVRYALMSVPGVSEVASVGGFVKEYQVELDPLKMRYYDVSLEEVLRAIRQSNIEVGAQTIEVNRVEYFVRGLGYIRSLSDLEEAVVKVVNNTPIRLRDIAFVTIGPAPRRGGLDVGGAEAVGGVVAMRYGENPKAVIQRVKERIQQIQKGLPERILPDGRRSKVTIVPFYDRTRLIDETIGTIERALEEEILITVIVVLLLLLNLRVSFLVSVMLPIGVLAVFILMKVLAVPAHIMSILGIAISIGVMVDIGIVLTEVIVRHLEEERHLPRLEAIWNGVREVLIPLMTAQLTTIVSFLPVFALEAQEGKLFKPVAITKTLAMASAVVLSALLVPALAYYVFGEWRRLRALLRSLGGAALIGLGIRLLTTHQWWGTLVILLGVWEVLSYAWERFLARHFPRLTRVGKVLQSRLPRLALIALIVTAILAQEWMPLTLQNTEFVNFLFVALVVGSILGTLALYTRWYEPLVRFALRHGGWLVALVVVLVLFAVMAWQGVPRLLGRLGATGERLLNTSVGIALAKVFPGFGREFMPQFDEGAFLLMPTLMPHAGVEEVKDIIALLDRRVQSIPEVYQVVGKWGRVESALDPAPISMFENIVNYRSEYITDHRGYVLRFKVNEEGAFVLRDGSTYNPATDSFRIIDTSLLIPDPAGKPFRQWRPHIRSPEDIWREVAAQTQNIPGLTGAPKLGPIQTRIVMLQTGMRAPMGIKLFGPDLQTLERISLQLEQILKEVPAIEPATVFAERVVGKPYIEIKPDRTALARYGMTVEQFNRIVEALIGGMPMTYTVEGRERYPVRARFAREWRDDPDRLASLPISTPTGQWIPLDYVADITYRRGPQAIKGENTFLVTYITFDKKEGFSEVDAVEMAQREIEKRIQRGELQLPAGVTYQFAGTYENQLRAMRRLSIIIPIALATIFLLLYANFRQLLPTIMVFSETLITFSGGMLLIWLYNQPWFLDCEVAGVNLRSVFNIHTLNMSVAVWIGFLALFGISTDNAVIMGSYILERFRAVRPTTTAALVRVIISAARRRVRPAMMTTATTLIALLPVLSAPGKGAEFMTALAVPTFGGMLWQWLCVLITPVLYWWWLRRKIRH